MNIRFRVQLEVRIYRTLKENCCTAQTMDADESYSDQRRYNTNIEIK